MKDGIVAFKPMSLVIMLHFGSSKIFYRGRDYHVCRIKEDIYCHHRKGDTLTAICELYASLTVI